MLAVYKPVFPSLLSLGRDGEEWSGDEKVLGAVPSSGKDLWGSEESVGRGRGFMTQKGRRQRRGRRRDAFPSSLGLQPPPAWGLVW